MGDELLDRIDAVLGHEDTVIDTDWEVSGDAMRSRPPADGELHPDEQPTLDLSWNRHAMCRSVLTPIITPPRRPPVPRGRVLELLDTLGLTPHLERACAGITRMMNTLHITTAPRPREFQPRTVTVTLVADTTAFMQAMDRMGRAARRAGHAAHGMTDALMAAMEAEISDQLERCLRLEQDLADIRRLGRREKVLARVWLEHRMVDMYADLGLTRDPSEEFIL